MFKKFIVTYEIKWKNTVELNKSQMGIGYGAYATHAG